MFNPKSNKNQFKKTNAFADLFSNPISIFEEKKKQNNKNLKLQSISKNGSKTSGHNKSEKQTTNKASILSSKKTINKKHEIENDKSKNKGNGSSHDNKKKESKRAGDKNSSKPLIKGKSHKSHKRKEESYKDKKVPEIKKDNGSVNGKQKPFGAENKSHKIKKTARITYTSSSESEEENKVLIKSVQKDKVSPLQKKISNIKTPPKNYSYDSKSSTDSESSAKTSSVSSLEKQESLLTSKMSRSVSSSPKGVVTSTVTDDSHNLESFKEASNSLASKVNMSNVVSSSFQSNLNGAENFNDRKVEISSSTNKSDDDSKRVEFYAASEADNMQDDSNGSSLIEPENHAVVSSSCTVNETNSSLSSQKTAENSSDFEDSKTISNLSSPKLAPNSSDVEDNKTYETNSNLSSPKIAENHNNFEDNNTNDSNSSSPRLSHNPSSFEDNKINTTDVKSLSNINESEDKLNTAVSSEITSESISTTSSDSDELDNTITNNVADSSFLRVSKGIVSSDERNNSFTSVKRKKRKLGQGFKHKPYKRPRTHNDTNSNNNLIKDEFNPLSRSFNNSQNSNLKSLTPLKKLSSYSSLIKGSNSKKRSYVVNKQEHSFKPIAQIKKEEFKEDKKKNLYSVSL